MNHNANDFAQWAPMWYRAMGAIPPSQQSTYYRWSALCLLTFISTIAALVLLILAARHHNDRFGYLVWFVASAGCCVAACLYLFLAWRNRRTTAAPTTGEDIEMSDRRPPSPPEERSHQTDIDLENPFVTPLPPHPAVRPLGQNREIAVRPGQPAPRAQPALLPLQFRRAHGDKATRPSVSPVTSVIYKPKGPPVRIVNAAAFPKPQTETGFAHDTVRNPARSNRATYPFASRSSVPANVPKDQPDPNSVVSSIPSLGQQLRANATELDDYLSGPSASHTALKRQNSRDLESQTASVYSSLATPLLRHRDSGKRRSQIKTASTLSLRSAGRAKGVEIRAAGPQSSLDRAGDAAARGEGQQRPSDPDLDAIASSDPAAAAAVPSGPLPARPDSVNWTKLPSGGARGSRVGAAAEEKRSEGWIRVFEDRGPQRRAGGRNGAQGVVGLGIALGDGKENLDPVTSKAGAEIGEDLRFAGAALYEGT
ncbi:hypothetical protein H2203_000912 [Taxawa tesnikishii (nom. ined.)]|nr:hypothetical protein H2203_000912 [Dothideales sp. JES 119]